MPNLHPFFVHLPIALLLLAFLLEVAALVWKNQELSKAAWWPQLAGTIGVGFSVASGLFAESTVAIPQAAQELFERHEQAAFVVAALFTALLFWRIADRTTTPQRNRAFYLLLFGAGVTLLLFGGWLGGELVFRYGVGVR